MSVLNEQGLSRLWGKIENNVKAAVQAEANARAEVDRGLREDLTELRNDFDEYQPPAYELVAEKHNPTAETGFIGLYNDYANGAVPLAAVPDNGLAAFLVDTIHDGENLYRLQAEKALKDDEGNLFSTTYTKAAAFTEHINNKDNPHAVTKAQVGLGNVDNTADRNKNVASAVKATQDASGNVITATYATKNELANEKSGLTEEINKKQNIITGAATTITSDDLTASRALISNDKGKVVVSDVTSTELGYLGGVTSAIQTQLDNKLGKDAQAADSAKLGGIEASSFALKASIDEINSDSTGILAQAKAYTDTTLKAYSTTENIAEIYETQIHAAEEIERIESLTNTEIEERAAADSSLQSQLDVLNGITETDTEGDRGKSVRTIAREELAVQLIPKEAQDSLDTLQEIASWIQDHPNDASAMNADILEVRKEVYGTATGEVPESGESRIDLHDSQIAGLEEKFVVSKADWNQNDETALDYIENRPFYDLGLTKTYDRSNILEDYVTVNNYGKFIKVSDATEIFNQIGSFTMEGWYSSKNSSGVYTDYSYNETYNIYDGFFKEVKNKYMYFSIDTAVRAYIVYDNSTAIDGYTFPSTGVYFLYYNDNIDNVNTTWLQYGTSNLTINYGLMPLEDKYLLNTVGKHYGIGQGEIFNYPKNLASGSCSHAEGRNTTASGGYSHTEGYGTKASNQSAHAEGYNTQASGSSSHAEGYGTKASSSYSHAEGNNTIASGNASHAEGHFSVASSSYSHAEGNTTAASGSCSHAEGRNTTASGSCSHAEGRNTTAQSAYQHVQGKYNVLDSSGKYAHIVGNGTSTSALSNAHTLDWDGNAWFKGEVYVGGTSQDDGKKLLTSDSINEALSDLGAITIDLEETINGNPSGINADTFCGYSIDKFVMYGINEGEDGTDEDDTDKEDFKPKTAVITLSKSLWADKEQSISCSIITADNIVIITPAPESHIAYSVCGVRATSQAADSLTFVCENIPAEDLNVNVLVLG